MKNKRFWKKILVLMAAVCLLASPFTGQYTMAGQDGNELPVTLFENETETPEITDTPIPAETPEVTETPIPTETPEVTETPAPAETPEVTETPAPTETPEITETPVPAETPETSQTPTPTETPEATETPTPAVTPGGTETPEIEDTPVPKIPLHSVTLKYASLAYTGVKRTQTGSIAVTALKNNEEILLTNKKDYTVAYRNNLNAGTATVTVTGTGEYEGTIQKTFTITPAPLKTLKLQYQTLTYTGKKRTQSAGAVVKGISNKQLVTLKSGIDYTISYSGDLIGPGLVTLKVTGKGNYTGTLKKTYKILPKNTALQSAVPMTRSVQLKWTKLPSYTDGCQIQYSTKSDYSSGCKKVTVEGNKAVSHVITGLTAGKTYYFRVRTYSVVKNVKYYSSWGSAKKAILKVNALSVKGSTNGKRTLILDNADPKLDQVDLALWSEANGQDDLLWVKAKKNSSGRWTASFSVKKYRNAGLFNLHAYSGGKFLSKKTFTIDPSEVETDKTKLAASLKAAKKNDQLILVGADGTECTVTMLNRNEDGSWFELLTTTGNVGLNGIGEVTEWNRKTPVGLYTITEGFGINANPGTAMPYTQVDDTYYWVDDVNSAYYNCFVTTKTTPWSWNSAEHIVDYTNSYQYCLAMDFNKDCVPGAGSAIFLHVGNGNPTLGCIGVPLAKMKKIMQYVRPGCKIIIDTPAKLKKY